MTGRPLLRAVSMSSLMKGSATHASSPHEVRQRLTDWRMGSGRSPQNAQLTSITRSAGRFPNPARAPNPPAANTALSRSVRNLFQIGSFIARSFCLLSTPPQLLRRGAGRVGQHAKRALIDVEEGFLLVDIVLVHPPDADDLAHDLGVEA